MILFSNRVRFYLCSHPVDMRNGREGLARIIREALGHDPLDYNEAFVFYSRDYRKVRILHYDVNGYVLYAILSRSLDNAIERCFRHTAIGRRNWLHTGSHESAQNIAFMFGLYESCKLNNLDFGHYIEDILTRIVNGEGIDESFIPCNYVSRPLEEETAA